MGWGLSTVPQSLPWVARCSGVSSVYMWPYYGGPEVQIHPLHDPQFLHSTVSFVHSTATVLHSTPPDSFTPLQHSFTRRPSFLHSTAKFLPSTIPCITVISVPCLRRKSQLPSDGHSSDALRALACAMYVFRWEMLAALIVMGIIDLQTPTYTKPPESPSNDTKS